MAPRGVSHTSGDASQPGARAILYCRTASTSRHGARRAVAEQSAALRGYALAHGYTVVAEYHDLGASATAEHRLGLEHAYADLDAGRADVLMVAGLTRLARFGPDLRRVLGRLDTAGARLVSLAERYDSGTPEGRALLLALTAEQGTEGRR